MTTLDPSIASFIRRRQSHSYRPNDPRAYALQTTPVAVLEIANRVHLSLDYVCGLDPGFAASFKSNLEKTDRELFWQLEQMLAHTPADDRSNPRMVSIATGLALTTHFLTLLRFAFKRAQQKASRKAKRGGAR